MKNKYDGFISYRHNESQTTIVRKLQRELHRFAKPWFKIRAVHLYRDETNLGVNPDLWKKIKEALDQSSFFILIASPETATSKWVNKELEYWLSTKSIEKIIIVLTKGTIEWDEINNSFHSSTNVLPKALQIIKSEPFWVDLSWVVDKHADLIITNHKFRDVIASISSTIRNIDKDKIIGEDITQHRKTKRIAAIIIVLIAILSLITIFVAFRYKNQKEETEIQKNNALSRLLASEGHRRLSSKENNSMAYFLSSLKVKESPTAVSGIFKSLQRDPHIAMNNLRTNDLPTATAYRSKLGIAAVGQKNGEILLWKIPLKDGKTNYRELFNEKSKITLKSDLSEAILLIAISVDGQKVTSLNKDGKIYDWDLTKKHPIVGILLDSIPMHDVVEKDPPHHGFEIAISENGNSISASTWSGFKWMWKRESGIRKVKLPNPTVGGPVALSDDGSLLVSVTADSYSPVIIYDLKNKTYKFLPIGQHTPGALVSLSISKNKKHIAGGTMNNNLIIWDLEDLEPNPRYLNHPTKDAPKTFPMPYVSSVIFDEASKYLASYFKMRWHIWDINSATLIGDPIVYSNVQ